MMQAQNDTRREMADRRHGHPLVTVIMPVYNAGVYLQEAVRSVFDQTFQDWELIMVDDGSTDGCIESLDCLDDPRVLLLRQPNSGKPVAMNHALRYARGEFYVLQDADDVSAPERIERQLAFLQANPEVAGVFCGCELIVDGRHVAPTFRAYSTEECARIIALGRTPAHDPTGMYRLSLVREFQYDEELPSAEGIDYILRIGERLPLAVIGECLYGYRWHQASVTKVDPGRRDRIMNAVLDRMAERRGNYASRRVDPTRSQFRNEITEIFSTSVAHHLAAGRRFDAIRTGLTGAKLGRSTLYRWKPLIYALMPRSIVALYRGARRRI